MQYILHPPRKTLVFATSNPKVADFLRKRRKWAGTVVEGTTLPRYVTTSSIRELDNGTVEIDAGVANGHLYVEGIRDLLIRDGIEEPDLRFIGRLVRPKRVTQVVVEKHKDEVSTHKDEALIYDDETASEGEMSIWSGDDLEEVK
jgi:hypothetical protein